jgi:hypothetical protein
MKWATSVGNFHENMHQRLTMCGVTNGSSDFDLINAYNRHTELVRDFARRTGHRLVEIDIESRSAGEVLAHEFGKPANCWKQANARLEKEAPTICYVGDSLVRMLYCAEFNVSECNFKDDHPSDRWSFKRTGQRGDAASSMTFDELRGRFFWRPTLKRLKTFSHGRGIQRGIPLDSLTHRRRVGTATKAVLRMHQCGYIVWNNLFHEVRDRPQLFLDVAQRQRALQEVNDALSKLARRVIFYASQRPEGSFAQERQRYGITMADAWRVDDRILGQKKMKALVFRADTYNFSTVDGRKYGAKQLATVLSDLKKFLVF